jgi:hypothetical protein
MKTKRPKDETAIFRPEMLVLELSLVMPGGIDDIPHGVAAEQRREAFVVPPVMATSVVASISSPSGGRVEVLPELSCGFLLGKGLLPEFCKSAPGS